MSFSENKITDDPKQNEESVYKETKSSESILPSKDNTRHSSVSQGVIFTTEYERKLMDKVDNLIYKVDSLKESIDGIQENLKNMENNRQKIKAPVTIQETE